MNFPLKNQDKDNTKSIFEETAFKNLSPEYQDYLQSGNRISLGKSSVLIPSEERKQADNDFDLDIQDVQDLGKRQNLLSLFSFLPISQEERQRMLHFKDKEIIDNLNSLLNSYNTETQHNDVLYFTFKENTLISAAGASSKSIGGRVLFRNMTGRFAWEFSYIQALGTKSIEDGPKTFEDINQKTFTVSSASLFAAPVPSEENPKEASEEKGEKNEIGLHVDVNPDVSNACHRDIFNELFEYIKSHVNDYAEVRGG